MGARVYSESWERAWEIEAMVAERLHSMGLSATHHTDKSLHPWDITLHLTGRNVPVEVKERPKLRWGQYEGIFLDVAKVHACLAEAPIMVFVVVTHDLTQRRAWIHEDDLIHMEVDSRDVKPAHHDADDPLDKGDHKYVVPNHWFDVLA